MTRPNWAQSVKEGDQLTIKLNFIGRGGQTGTVVDTPDGEGASLDFFTCGLCGAKQCSCYTSIEFWNWNEIEEISE